VTGFDRIAIAARIRGLLAGQDNGDPAAAAARLGVDETGLRMSIDDLAPNPTIDVIAAVVGTYGVDPVWLLTGEYDPAIHRGLLEDHQPVERTISRLMSATIREVPTGPFLRLMRE
jgi:hypothetical protein